MTTYLFGIEPIEMRYSADWRNWFKDRESADLVYVDGDTFTSGIENGEFLDVTGTQYYKASQVQTIARLLQDGIIKDDDQFFFLDAWFPLDAVFYMLDCLGMKTKVAGVLHAGAYDSADFLFRSGCTSWARGFENALFQRLDRIVVFSEFHARMLMEKVGIERRRIEVTSFPYDAGEKLDGYDPHGRRDIDVVFPHRIAPEKNPWIVDALRSAGLTVVVTAEECQTKDEYFDVLSRSLIAVSWNDQETFGIAMAEAAYLGCIVLCRRALCYPEIWGNGQCFDIVGELVHACRFAVDEINSLSDEDYTASRNGPFAEHRQSIEDFLRIVRSY